MEHVDPLENLSRFILQSNCYRPSDNRVRYSAFMPNPNNNETSVFRTSGVSDKAIWDIGERNIQRKPILGRADIITSVVLSNGLNVLPKEPPERHANISNWPGEKSKQKLVALQLAEEANLRLR